MKRIYNSIGLIIIALTIFGLSAYLDLGADQQYSDLEGALIQDVIFRILGFWLFSFVLVAVLVILNHLSNKRRTQSYINIVAVGAMANLVFATIGSFVFYFGRYAL